MKENWKWFFVACIYWVCLILGAGISIYGLVKFGITKDTPSLWLVVVLLGCAVMWFGDAFSWYDER